MCGRYYNANGFAVAIVAVINEGCDWAAYIGATDGDVPMEQTVEFVARHGCKVEQALAEAVFGRLVLPYRL